jgi:hypothetical protein
MANMLPQEPLTTQPVRWSPAHRSPFRFVCFYFVLYNAPAPFFTKFTETYGDFGRLRCRSIKIKRTRPYR